MKKENKVLRVLKYLLITILVLVLMVNIFIIIQSKLDKNKVPSLFGYKPFIVLSSSMETEIYAGDLVITENVDPKDLKENDIIAFKNSKDYVTTHRIISIVEKDDICFETKGDNNNTKDLNIVCSKDIEGRYIKRIPKLGNILLFFQKPYGLAILLLMLIMVVLLMYISVDDKRKISKKEYEEFQEYKKKNKKD